MHVGPSSNSPHQNLPNAVVHSSHTHTLTSFMKTSMTDPTCPLSPLSSPRTQLEYCRAVSVQFSGLLRSQIALLSIQIRCELLESMGRVSGFSHTPKALHGAPLSREAQQGLVVQPLRSCFYLSTRLQGPWSPNSSYTRSWLAIKCKPTL